MYDLEVDSDEDSEEEVIRRFKTKWLIEYMTAFTSTRLVSSIVENPEMKNLLRFQNPLKGLFLKRISIKCRLKSFFQLLCNLFGIYILLEFFKAMRLQYRRDLLMANWAPVLIDTKQAQDNKQSNYCDTNKADNLLQFEQDKKKFTEIIYLTTELYQGINYNILLSGSPILLMFYLHQIIIGYFWVGILGSIEGLKVDCFSFMLNPYIERSLAIKEIEKIFDQLTDSLDNTVLNSHLKFDSVDNKHEIMYKDDNIGANINCIEHQIENNQFCRLSCNRNKQIKLVYTSIYKNLLQEMKNNDLVRPYVLTKKCHKRLCFRFQQAASAFFWCGILSVVVTIVLYGLKEIDLRIRQRLEYYKCIPGETIVTNFIYTCFFSKLNQQEEASFLKVTEYEEISLADKMELIYIESKSYFNDDGRIANYFIMTLVGLFCCVQTVFYGACFVFSVYYKLLWFNQIDQQSNQCLMMMNQLNELSKEDRSLGPHEGERNLQLYRYLTVTYVNFELLRRKHKNFQKLITFFMLQVSVIGGPTIYSLNISLATTPVGSKLMYLFILSFIISHVNIYLILTAMLTNRIEKHRGTIIQLLAASKRNTFQYCHIMNSWLRQLTSPEDTNRLYAPSFAGIYVNYTNILTINGYMIAIICLLSLFD